MSLYGSLFSGVSGLNAQSLALGTISENITNVNTVGFKSKTSHFATLVTGSSGDGSVGGVQHLSVRNVNAQGILQQTTNGTDLGISGDGFFVVNTQIDNGGASGDLLFTRAGHFDINDGGLLANANGHFLMGWKLNPDGDFIDETNNIITPDPTSDADLLPVDLSTIGFSAQGTTQVDLSANFPASMAVADTFTIPSTVLDELGGAHNLSYGFTKVEHVNMSGTLTDDATTDFTISNISTPATFITENPDDPPTFVDDTSINAQFAFDSIDGDGNSVYTVTVTANNGTVDATASPFTVVFDADGAVDDSLRELEITWDNDGLNNSIIAFDVGDIAFNQGGAFDPLADAPLESELNTGNAVMKLAVSTATAGDTVLSGDGTFVEFSDLGNLVTPSELETVIDWGNQNTFAPNSTITANLGALNSADGLSAGGDKFQLGASTQNGIAFDAFEGISIDNEGFVIAEFKNGTSLAVFRIPVADFGNPNGLRESEGNAFQPTLESGDFFLNIPGDGGSGTITPRTLEASTVDIAREFANMIITQRAFSSSSTVITTADEMLQELVQIKR